MDVTWGELKEIIDGYIPDGHPLILGVCYTDVIITEERPPDPAAPVKVALDATIETTFWMTKR